MVKATCYSIYDMDYNMATRFTDACSMAIHFGEEEWRAQMQENKAEKWKK